MAPAWLQHPALALVLLGGVMGYALVVSWRRWPDALVDAGRELYVPWRLAEGAVLYRDVDDFYGPLSQYFNAAVFQVFGPGLIVLAWVNIVLFAAMLFVLHRLLRQAWGAAGAFAGAVVFVGIFGFSRFSLYGNYNYALPYAHEATHGVLVLLLLAGVLARLLQERTRLRLALAGLLGGLTLVLKPEIAAAAGLLTAGALLLGWRNGIRLGAAQAALWAAAASVPTLLFFAFFLRHGGAGEAWSAAGRAWLNVLATREYMGDPAQAAYLGFDRPGPLLLEHLRATGIALGIGGVLVGAGLAVNRLGAPVGRLAVAVALLVLISIPAWRASSSQWIQVGRCLPLLALLLAVWQGVAGFRRDGARDPAVQLRLLLSLLALALLARMALNGRIFQFGFYQAALSAVVVVAFLVGELPRWVGMAVGGRATVWAGVGALLLPGLVILMDQNYRTHRLLSYPIGTGRDTFNTFQPGFLSPSSHLLAGLVDELSRRPADETVLVLPEGLMINYLTRKRSPLPHFFYYSVVTENGREARLVQTLRTRPPAWVVLVAQDLREYGIQQYGERPGRGQELLAWVAENYESAGSVDGAPMELRAHGIQLFRLKPGLSPTGRGG